jgi:hypothetical protein
MTFNLADRVKDIYFRDTNWKQKKQISRDNFG